MDEIDRALAAAEAGFEVMLAHLDALKREKRANLYARARLIDKWPTDDKDAWLALYDQYVEAFRLQDKTKFTDLGPC